MAAAVAASIRLSNDPRSDGAGVEDPPLARMDARRAPDATAAEGDAMIDGDAEADDDNAMTAAGAGANAAGGIRSDFACATGTPCEEL